VAKSTRTIYEDRIDFERIERQRESREEATLAELRSHTFRMQRQVLKFVDSDLAGKKLKTAVTRFKMPLVPKYREIVRRRMTQAYTKGNRDVEEELSLRKRKLRQPEIQRIRESSDALVAVHIGELEGNLKKAWAKAMNPPIDKVQLRYVTKKVFADFTGWEQPTPE